MTTTLCFAGQGFICSKSLSMNCGNMLLLNDPAQTAMCCTPSREIAGRIDSLKQDQLTQLFVSCSPVAPNKVGGLECPKSPQGPSRKTKCVQDADGRLISNRQVGLDQQVPVRWWRGMQGASLPSILQHTWKAEQTLYQIESWTQPHGTYLFGGKASFLQVPM